MISVAIVNAKGGVGKTTISTQIAVRCLDNFERVGIIDLDPSGGTRRWFEARAKSQADVQDGESEDEAMPRLYVGVSNPADALAACKLDGMDIVILDGAPGTIDATKSVIGMVDAIVIPEKCSEDDMESAAMVARMCRDAGKTAIGVVNDVPLPSDRRPYQLEMAERIAKSIEAYGMDVAMLRSRDIYLKAKNGGVGVHEIQGRTSSEARKEIDELYLFVVKALAESAKP